MGCDIHGWVEIKQGDKYIAISEIDGKARIRNYDRFAKLAGVRSSGLSETPKPLGIPDDISDTVRYWIDDWAEDGHSHSYLPLKDAADIFLETDYGQSEFDRLCPVSSYFDFEYEGKVDDCRLVFWFDN